MYSVILSLPFLHACLPVLLVWFSVIVGHPVLFVWALVSITNETVKRFAIS